MGVSLAASARSKLLAVTSCSRVCVCMCSFVFPRPGHMGIADSRGVIYDFAGPYTIGEDHMAFGRPTRYLQLDPGRCKGERWDEAVARASETYRWGHEQR